MGVRVMPLSQPVGHRLRDRIVSICAVDKAVELCCTTIPLSTGPALSRKLLSAHPAVSPTWLHTLAEQTSA